ncbi:hypothetical protein P10159_1720 [Citrobacter portucalensis]|nr:hypothetical protein P10159_1720 [Citrobacter portucalensis]
MEARLLILSGNDAWLRANLSTCLINADITINTPFKIHKQMVRTSL